MLVDELVALLRARGQEYDARAAAALTPEGAAILTKTAASFRNMADAVAARRPRWLSDPIVDDAAAEAFTARAAEYLEVVEPGAGEVPAPVPNPPPHHVVQQQQQQQQQQQRQAQPKKKNE